ncbi:MAG: START domain-containing protein [Bdellovibrio sp.]
MNILFKIVLFSSFFVQSSFALTENDFQWEISSQSNDITVFKAEKHESGVVPIKALTIFNHSISRVLSLIADTPKKVEWVPYLLEGTIVEKDGPFKRVEYARYKSPWPFQDRVFILNIVGDYNEVTHEVSIELKSVDHPKYPENNDTVRGITYYGAIRIKKLEENKSFFEIVLLSDFKGNVPHWIVNMVQAKWPYKMFTQMREQLNNPNFQLNPEYDIDLIIKNRRKNNP